MSSNDIITSLTHKAKFFEYSLDFMCVLTVDGIIQDANTSLLTSFGYSIKDIKGKSLLHLIAETDRSEFVTAFDDMRNISHPISIECRLDDTGNLDQMWYLWTLYPEVDGYHLAIGRDISAYKLMEDKERERKIFAEALLDTVLAINTSLSLEQVLRRILSNVGRVVTFDYVNILLVSGRYAQIVGSHRRSPQRIDVRLNDEHQFLIADNHYLKRMTTAQGYLIIDHVEESLHWMTAGDAIYKTGSFLGSPIIVDEELIGFIGIFYEQADFFTPLHAQQLMTFANQVGIAINNAHLYAQSQSIAVLQERQRVAQELHDSVNQDLFAASTYADLLVKAINRKPDIAIRYSKDIAQLIRGAVDQMRMILIELHPDALAKTPLPILIDRLAQTFTKRTGIPIIFHNQHNFILNEKTQIEVYRIVQEILHNVEKHAQAGKVQIQMIYKFSRLELTVEDNGIGFDQTQVDEFHYGLQNMQDRASAIGASLNIDSPVGVGTTIKLVKVDIDEE